MALYSESDFGQLSGKWGEYVAATWLGRNVLRRYPARVPNPRTLVQQANRGRFATAVQLAKGFLTAIRMGYGMAGPQRSAYNHFLSAALAHIEQLPGLPPQVHYPQLPLSQGSLAPPSILGLQAPTDRDLVVSWSSPLRPTGPPFLAIAAAVLVDAQPLEFALSFQPEFQQQATLTWPRDPQPGEVAHAYLFALDPVNGEPSPTRHRTLVY